MSSLATLPAPQAARLQEWPTNIALEGLAMEPERDLVREDEFGRRILSDLGEAFKERFARGSVERVGDGLLKATISFEFAVYGRDAPEPDACCVSKLGYCTGPCCIDPGISC